MDDLEEVAIKGMSSDPYTSSGEREKIALLHPPPTQLR
jgi:hypothetical protein